MNNKQHQTQQLAERLDKAAITATATPQLSQDYPEINLSQAYQIQQASIARRLSRKERLVGVKMGFTSRAKMVQMGVDDLIWGQLTDNMQLVEGGILNMQHYVHPRIEPEIAFRLKKSLKGKVSLTEAMAAVEAIAPALEIIDSRYANFKFSLTDVVADNSSSSAFVLGPWCAPSEDISNQAMILCINGRPQEVGSSAAILGNPYRSLVEAARLASESGLCLEAGWTVLAGAATAAQALSANSHIQLKTSTLGDVHLYTSAAKQGAAI
ncbi:2-keto-4-pentenoate hydratase [Lacimicrobium alkaliphilum]|uniref:4-oxalocrotonate decarboxylase n=1 Tax=Lacimicrobium alkaliphilum TaxID=1526571 RepID=A0A0U3AG71_9ALTE|nr:fumarylacetoacetate hydrolase family protein [Lacimicrobium alkaliphilum]ALS97042.1 4-oxalocrotonate decarboxylase [Lacimicrobium alkaliphilum]